MKQEEERKVGCCAWLYGVIAGGCVAAMQIGVGLLQVEGEFILICLRVPYMFYGIGHNLRHFVELYGDGRPVFLKTGILLQVEGEFTIMLGAAQGLLVGSLTVICGS